MKQATSPDIRRAIFKSGLILLEESKQLVIYGNRRDLLRVIGITRTIDHYICDILRLLPRCSHIELKDLLRLLIVAVHMERDIVQNINGNQRLKCHEKYHNCPPRFNIFVLFTKTLRSSE